jgi:hypothetical protein
MSSPVPHRIALTARLNIEVRDGVQRPPGHAPIDPPGAAGSVFHILQIVYEIEQDLVTRFDQHRVELGQLEFRTIDTSCSRRLAFHFPGTTLFWVR